MNKIKAMVLVEPGRLSPMNIPAKTIHAGGWLAIEATGLSGLEVQAWRGERRGLLYPLIPGQQMVGRIAGTADDFTPFSVGTRVVVEPNIRCGKCKACSNFLASCRRRKPLNVYGGLPSTEPPGLWGGLAELLYLDPQARLHEVSDDIAAEAATFVHSLATGYTWAVETPNMQPEESVLILGPGPRGLGCLIAAQNARAGWIGITGLDVDGDRLDMAAKLGADTVINISSQEISDAVANSLGDRPDVVIDVTSDDPEAIYSAMDLVRPGGRVILASTKGGRGLGNFVSDVIVAKQLQVVGALGASTTAYKWATKQIAEDPRIDKLVSHQFPLEEAERAIQATAGQLGHEELISVAVTF